MRSAGSEPVRYQFTDNFLKVFRVPFYRDGPYCVYSLLALVISG